jgi:hypothetical protein
MTGINKGWIFKIYASKLSYLSLEKRGIYFIFILSTIYSPLIINFWNDNSETIYI